VTSAAMGPGPAGGENPLRHLIVPAILTALAIPLDAAAWLAGDMDLLYTALFWEGLMWAGVLLFLAGRWADAFLQPRTA
jgi:hypothetical protein